MRQQNRFTLVIFCFFLLFPLPVFSQQLDYPEISGLTPAPGITIEEFAHYLYQFSLVAGAILAIGFFIYGGFSYLTSAGNVNKMKEAKDQIVSSLLGLLILFSSYLILSSLDPQLTLFQTGQQPVYPLLLAPEIEPEPARPKGHRQLTTLKEKSNKLADFLGAKTRDLWWFTDGPLGARGFLTFLEEAKEPECSDGQTRCEPESGSTMCVPINCQWKESPEKKLLLKIEDTENGGLLGLGIGLEGVRDILEELVESEEAKKLKGDLNMLENCLKNPATKLKINNQLAIDGTLDYLNIANRNSLYFYCLSY